MSTMTKPLHLTWQNNTNPNWWLDKGLRKSMITIFVLYFSIFNAGYDGSLLNGLQTLQQWQQYFDNPSGSDLGLISVSMYFPNLVLPFISAWISDKWGRKPPILAGNLLIIAGSLIVTFATSRGMFIAGRVVIGLGAGTAIVPIAPLIAELAHPVSKRLRAVASASYLCIYYVGSTCSAWICFGTQNMQGPWAWRLPSIFCCLGAVIMAVYQLLGQMEESPRYLIRSGQREKGYQLVADLHGNGDLNDELVRRELAEIEADLERDKMSEPSTYMSFFKTAGNRKRLLVIFLIGTGTQLNGVGLVSYYLAPILELVGITNNTQQAGLNGGLAIFNLFCAIGAAQVVETWGRRPLWLTGNTGQLVSFIIVTALSGSFASSGKAATGTAVIPFLFIYYGFYDICWTVLPNLYLPEVVPFHLRTKGMCLYNWFIAISNVFNQYVNPIALQNIAWKYYIVYVVVILGYLISAYLFFPETKGYTIEEVGRLFDGEASVDELERSAEVNTPEVGKPGAEHKENV